MTEPQVISDSVLEELMDAEIPCMGSSYPVIKGCTRTATMHLIYFHDCPGNGAPTHRFKCFDCYQKNYAYNVATMAATGLRCAQCYRCWPKGADFDTFMRYAPL